MVYLSKFRLATPDEETDFILSYPYQLEMQCYSHNNVYPFKLFPNKSLHELCFEPITIFYGGNGSGKSTLLNIIAQKLQLQSSVHFNNTPFMEEYLKFCRYEFAASVKRLPQSSAKITSDGVFDFLLDIRAINEGVGKKRDELFDEYYHLKENPMKTLSSLSEFEDFKKQLEAKRSTKSAYTARRLPHELDGKSNGESAFVYFTDKIRDNALYLLDEPENSLSAKLQTELVSFIEDSARFYNCQFIIATHSPFLLAMKHAKIYDLDSIPVTEKKWTELENVRVYYEFFKKHSDQFC